MNHEASRAEQASPETTERTLAENSSVMVLIESEASRPTKAEALEAEIEPERLPAIETSAEGRRVIPLEPLVLPPQASEHPSLLDFIAPNTLDTFLGPTANFVIAPPQVSAPPAPARRVTLPPKLNAARSLERRLQGLTP